MKQVFADDLVTLYQGDCREVLPSLGEAADLILADPPYGETALDWDRRVKGWADVCAAGASPSASLWVFGSLRFLAETWAEFGAWTYAEDVIWEKHNGAGVASDRFRRVHEQAAHFYRGAWADVFSAIPRTADVQMKGASVRRRASGEHLGSFAPTTYERGETRLQRSVVKVRSCHGHAVHPTQKPEAIARMLIEASCPLGGLVFVPFAGSGTELIAARQLGRRAIGVELRPEYCRIASTRLAQGDMALGR